jgi:hypothetical protein
MQHDVIRAVTSLAFVRNLWKMSFITDSRMGLVA